MACIPLSFLICKLSIEDCRPAGDDARTGAAHNPRKLKRAARRACCFCALPLRLKQAWSQVLGTKKPQAFAWGFLWVWRSEADLCISEIKCSFLACYRLFFGKIGAFGATKAGFWSILWELLWRSVSTNVGTILLCFGFVLPPVSI